MAIPTYGANLPYNHSDSATNGRLGWVKEMGVKLLRTQDSPASTFATIFTQQGAYCHPTLFAANFTSYVQSLYNSDGTPKTGFCGVAEIFNEPYFSSGGNYSATGYYNAIIAAALATKAALPQVKLLINGVTPGQSVGTASTTWMQDILNAFNADSRTAGKRFQDIFYGWNFHLYCRGTNPYSTSSPYGLVWNLWKINQFLVAKGLTSMPIWDNEHGFSVLAAGGTNTVPDETTQNTYTQHAIDVHSDPATYVNGAGLGGPTWQCRIEAALAFELLDNLSAAGTNEGGFGFANNGSFSNGPTAGGVRKKASWNTYKAAVTASNSAGNTGNFTGAVTPPPPTTGQAAHFGISKPTSADWSVASIPVGEQKQAWNTYKATLATSGSANFTGAGGGGGTVTSITYTDSPHGAIGFAGTIIDSRSGPAHDSPTGAIGLTGSLVEEWGPTGLHKDAPAGVLSLDGSLVESWTRGETFTPTPVTVQAEVDAPHFAFPFAFQADGQVTVVQQDTVQEVAASVANIATCPQGFRVDQPDFGVPDQSFSNLTLDTSALGQAIGTQEPRASVTIDQQAQIVTFGGDVHVGETLYPEAELLPSDDLLPGGVSIDAEALGWQADLTVNVEIAA